jgi:hypothetical protein
MMNYVRLLEECEEGDLQTVQAMLYSGVSPNFPEGRNLGKWKEYAYRPLQAVALNNDIPILRVLRVLGAHGEVTQGVLTAVSGGSSQLDHILWRQVPRRNGHRMLRHHKHDLCGELSPVAIYGIVSTTTPILGSASQLMVALIQNSYGDLPNAWAYELLFISQYIVTFMVLIFWPFLAE